MSIFCYQLRNCRRPEEYCRFTLSFGVMIMAFRDINLFSRSPVCPGRADAAGADPRGLFPPDSPVWRINKELALMLGGGRALLMQIAHPMIARGVLDHSDFQQRPVARLRHTLLPMLDLIFGDLATARATAARMVRRHHSITGEMPEDVGGFTRQRRYFATNPALQMWVFATLVDSALVTYERFFHPLTAAEKAQFYRESCHWGRLLGITADALPPDFPAFMNYLDEMLHGPQICPGRAGRRLAAEVLQPKVRYLPALLIRQYALITTGLLPAVMREKFGFAWDARRERRFRRIISGLRLTLRCIPERLRSLPAAYRAKKRFN